MMAKDTSKYSFNIVLLGDKSVGKTDMLKAYLGHYFTNFDAYSTNLDDHSHVKHTRIDERCHSLYLWEWASSSDDLHDTGVTLDPAVLRKAHSFLLCYAMNNATSFRNIELKWIPIIKKEAPKTPIILVGTKLDLKNCYGGTKVSDLTVQKMKLRTKAFSVLECSARSFEGIQQIFKEALLAGAQHQELPCSIS